MIGRRMRLNSIPSSSDIQSDGQALGFVEVASLADAIICLDAALKAASVTALPTRLNDGSVTVRFSGQVADVTCAVEAAASAAGMLGHLLAKLVIPNAHGETRGMLGSGGDLSAAPELASRNEAPGARRMPALVPDGGFVHAPEQAARKIAKAKECNFVCSLCRDDNCEKRKIYH